MITKETIIDGVSYLLVDIVPVSQKSGNFYLGKIQASDLVQIFTVSPTDYDINKNVSLSKSFPSDEDYYNNVLHNMRARKEKQGFQRNLKSERAGQIKKFLETEEYPFFPNTIIASCDLINDAFDTNSRYEDFKNTPNKPDNLGFVYKDQETGWWKLLIPKKKKSVLVIDGQHRLEGLKRWLEEHKEDYEVLVSFIIGYNRSVIAQQFYTINYEQKPVNKSLLLHLTAEFSEELNETTFLHNIVKLLNEHSTSPLQKRIKMLGVTPPELGFEERKLLSVSQAFMIDRMARFINSNSTSSKLYPPIFLHYFRDKDYHIHIIRFLICYLSAIKEMRNDWEDPANSVLSKSMGIGAFLTALHTIFPIMFVRKWNLNLNDIKEVNINTFKDILSGIENINFEIFSGGGSLGTMNKIKESILENIKYKERGEREEFKKWLEEQKK